MPSTSRPDHASPVIMPRCWISTSLATTSFTARRLSPLSFSVAPNASTSTAFTAASTVGSSGRRIWSPMKSDLIGSRAPTGNE